MEKHLTIVSQGNPDEDMGLTKDLSVRKRIKKEDLPSLKRLISKLTAETSETSKIAEAYSKNTTDLLHLNNIITHAESRNESTN
ncbi:hypothetical protein G9A89_021788 [Geosiphon pyriformis]|nr:hypothetical protein G9A89_021788 [Geosiphon pyriformis]